MYIINNPIRVDYQPAGASAGLVVKMEILDETGYTDETNYPVVTMVELPLAGGSIYRSEFTPDTVGIWEVRVFVEGRTESLIKQYVVNAVNMEGLISAPPTIA